MLLLLNLPALRHVGGLVAEGEVGGRLGQLGRGHLADVVVVAAVVMRRRQVALGAIVVVVVVVVVMTVARMVVMMMMVVSLFSVARTRGTVISGIKDL